MFQVTWLKCFVSQQGTFVHWSLFYIFSLVVSTNPANQNKSQDHRYPENTQAFRNGQVREISLITNGHWVSNTFVHLQLSAPHHMQHREKVPLPTGGEWPSRDPSHSQSVEETQDGSLGLKEPNEISGVWVTSTQLNSSSIWRWRWHHSNSSSGTVLYHMF